MNKYNYLYVKILFMLFVYETPNSKKNIEFF